MARSRDPMLLALAAVLAAASCSPAQAAPATAEQKAARKQRRAEQKAGRPKPTTPDRPARPDEPATAKLPSPPLPAAPGPALPACPPDNTLTWRSFGAGFLLTWCTGCHSSHLAASARQDAPDAVNFDTLAGFKPHARIVYERAVLAAHAATVDPNAASPMPPAGLPPEADRRRLAQWIACGSPQP